MSCTYIHRAVHKYTWSVRLLAPPQIHTGQTISMASLSQPLPHTWRVNEMPPGEWQIYTKTIIASQTFKDDRMSSYTGIFNYLPVTWAGASLAVRHRCWVTNSRVAAAPPLSATPRVRPTTHAHCCAHVVLWSIGIPSVCDCWLSEILRSSTPWLWSYVTRQAIQTTSS